MLHWWASGIFLSIQTDGCSSLSKQGITELRDEACKQLLELRLSVKFPSKKAKSVMDMLQVTFPERRDDKERGVSIPQSVLELRAKNAQTRTVINTGRTGREEQSEMEVERDASGVERRKTQKDIQWEHGGYVMIV